MRRELISARERGEPFEQAWGAAEAEALALAGLASQSERGRNVEISGWAVNVKFRRPATTIFLFADGRFVAATRPTVQRPDVSRTYKASLDQTGFKLELPLSVLQRGQQAPKLQLLAEADGVASRLTLTCKPGAEQFGC